MSKALFQLWLSCHANAMAHRVNLDSSSVSPEARECANQVPSLVPHFILRALDRFELPLTFFVFPLGVQLFSLFRAQALCFADSVLCAFTTASTFLEEYDVGVMTWRNFLIVVLLCRFLALFHSLQRARNTAWAATCLFLGRFPALCFTPRWHQGCVQSLFPALAFKPCSSNGPLSHSRSQVSTFSVVCECTISVPPPGSSHHFATQALSLFCFTSRKSATWVFHFAQFLCCCAYLSVFGATLSLRSVPRLGSFFFFACYDWVLISQFVFCAISCRTSARILC